MKQAILISFLFLFGSLVVAQTAEDYLNSRGEVYFSFTIFNKAELEEITKIISIDKISGDKIYAYASRNEFEKFSKMNFDVNIEAHPGDDDPGKVVNSIEEISEWDAYPTYGAYVQMMETFAADYPDICRLVDAGNTVLNRKILFVVISDNVEQREAEPQFMYSSTMHGDETAGYVLMLRLIDSLLTSYGNDDRITEIINGAEIWINPLANPDGTYRSDDNTLSGATRTNWNGYDLNRNFPDPVAGQNPNGPWQPETIIMKDLADNNRFVLSANFHGGAEVVNYPWDHKYTLHADNDWYVMVCREYADTVHAYSNSYMTGFDDGITNGADWYIVHGGRQDYYTYFAYGRETTIELSNQKLLNAALLPAHWEYNKRSLLNYIEQSLYGISGIVTLPLALANTSAKVEIIGHDLDHSEVYTDPRSGNYHRLIEAGTYSLTFSAPGYVTKTIDDVVVSDGAATILNVTLDKEIVPVELNFFTAQLNDNKVFLNWQTATEVNNFGFEVERFDDDVWTKITFVEGKGTTSEKTNYSYIDETFPSGELQYRLKQIDFDGTFVYSNIESVNAVLASEITLHQNYPNPFNPTTNIKFTVSIVGTNHDLSLQTNLIVYDLLGREVATLVNQKLLPGNYEFEFNGEGLSSGIYYYVLKTVSKTISKKMILMK